MGTLPIPSWRSDRRKVALFVTGALALAALTAGIAAKANGADAVPRLRLEAQSDKMSWNAVVSARGRIFVSGPRWAGAPGPQVAEWSRGALKPFPNAGWNSWKPGDDAGSKFVNVNSLRLDKDGSLWVVDTGSPTFGGDPLPGGAKIVKIDIKTGGIVRIVRLKPHIARPGTYVDDVRFHGRHAYMTDAGNPGIIILDLDTGESRRVLDGHPSVTASRDRPIVVDGAVLKAPDGKPLTVQSDPFELSPDGEWLMYGPLEGPWSKIPTRVLDDRSLSSSQIAAAVRPFADLPPMGGSVMDAAGNLYFSDLKADAIRRRSPDGTISTVVQDPRLHWVDAMFIDTNGKLWLPAAQLDRVALFHGGKSRVKWPVQLYSLSLGLKPE